jgi:pyruvate dehydrogenase E2 component (dihydrolipoamide acetyltransferase)
MNDMITPVVMPKWGLSMSEGLLAEWHVAEGDEIAVGDEIMDVETDKIASAVEAADGGLLRRIVGEEGETYRVQSLLAILAPVEVPDVDIDAYIAAFETPEQDQEDEEAGPAFERIEISSGYIRYAYRPGDGVPVLLIHGFGGDLDNWLFNIDAIAAEYPVYALDLPGHGQSGKVLSEPNLELLVSAVVEFLGLVGIEKVHLVGHSMGGLIAAKLALEHRQLVQSLCLISSAGLGPEINGGYIDGFVQSTSRRDLKPNLLHLFKDGSLVNRSLIDDVLKYKRLDGVHEVLGALASALFGDGRQSEILAADLDACELPMTVIWGKDDAIIPATHASVLTSGNIHIVEDAGHMVQMEQAGKVNALIKAHIKSSC